MNALHRVGCTLGLALCLDSAVGQNYPVQPVPASFIQDSNTTFLVNLTTIKTQADYALGDGRLNLNTSNFVVGSGLGAGYTGPIGISASSNFPTNAWTVELIIDLPYQSMVNSSNNPIGLIGWQNDALQCSFNFALDPASGVWAQLYSWNSGAGYFLTSAYCGGSTYSIQASTTDKLVYIGVGFDPVAQQFLTAAREVSGAILNSNIVFVPRAGASNSPAAYSAMQRYFSRSLPSNLNIGSNLVQVQAIRISNIFRTNLFNIAPLLAVSSATNWLPFNLDPSRATSQTVSRMVGYPGVSSHNYVTMQVNEPYLPLAPGAAPISIQLTNVPIGLYTLYLYGVIDPKGRTNLNQVWLPCSMNFRAVDAGGALLAQGQMPLKEYLEPSRMMGFQFHLDTQPTNVTLTFSVPANAVETPWIEWINLRDDLAGLPDVAVKRSQYLFSGGATNQDTSLTPARMARDDAIWSSVSLLNYPFQTPPQVKEFQNPPSNVTVDGWITKAFLALSPAQTPPYVFSTLDMLDTNSGVAFPASAVLSTNTWPGPFPEYPTGVFYSKSNYPSLATDIYNTDRAIILGARVSLFLGAIMNPQGQFLGSDLPWIYFSNGVVDTGHDAALALVRWAYDWPAVECNLSEIRYCLMSPDLDFGVDESRVPPGNGYQLGGGKIQGNQDASDAIELFKSYDQLFPYIQGNQIFASAVHRYIPWVNTPQDVIRLLDRYLVFSTIRDVNAGEIDPSAGVLGFAGQVLGPGPYTAPLFDLTHQYSVIYPASGGTYQEMYGTALSRSGTEYIGSFMCYGFASAVAMINQSYSVYWAKNAGITAPMDLSNTNTYPKACSAADYLINMWVAGGFPFMIGDASGGPHSSLFSGEANAMSVLGAPGNQSTLAQVWQMWHDSRYAWLLKNLWGSNSADIVAAAATVNPIATNASRVVPDWGVVIEANPAETNPLNKTAATIRLGVGQGHVHNDYLDLNLFGFGAPLAVDLACRNEGTFWSLPAAGSALVHNHAMAGSTLDPAHSASQSGEPWLKAFAPPLVRACYNDGNGSQLDRHTFVMQIGTSNLFYLFDNQWLSGSTYHTWCFHGCESSDLAVNVPMSPLTTRFTGTTYPGSQYVGPGTNVLQAVWTMTRSTQSFVDGVDGGTFTTVACEPTVLGTNYNAALPPVQVRATLLGRANDTVLQGNPYSAVYQYCFPFLWSQTSNETASVYPAVYDWYRGAPFVSNIVLLATNPVRVQVSAAAQTDTYECATNYFLAVSRDTSGVRYVKLNGYDVASLPDLTVNPAPDYAATITAIDYRARTLTTSSPLPANPLVTVGNSGRLVSLQLYGSGTTFYFNDDLLVAEGRITSLHVASPSTIAITLDQGLLFDGCGNRHSTNMVLSTEDGSWHFRNNGVIASPVNTPLTTDVFTDANGDGLIDAKLYEIGEGDVVALPVDITIQRSGSGWSVQTNVPVTGSINNSPFSFSASGAWQFVGGAPSAPTLLGGVPGP